VDGYHFDSNYQRDLKAEGLQVVFIDDSGHAGPYTADVIVNQNAYAEEILYERRDPNTRLLLGSDYVMLRREFLPWRQREWGIPDVGRKILVTMGGSDPDNVALSVIGALSEFAEEGLETVVVAGGSNPNLASLGRMAARGGRLVQVVRDSANMPELMAWANMAIIPAGGTLWELLFMGCPVLSYARSPIQGKIVSGLAHEGVVRDLGYHRDLDPVSLRVAIADLARHPECRRRMSALGRERIDGRGAARICQLLITQAAGNSPR